jgi:hypothetical protein
VEKVLEKQDAQRAKQMATAREMRETATSYSGRNEEQKDKNRSKPIMPNWSKSWKGKMDQWKAIRAERMKTCATGME